MAEFTDKFPVIVCTQTAHGNIYGKNVLRRPVLSGPLESDIRKVWNMLEISTEKNVY